MSSRYSHKKSAPTGTDKKPITEPPGLPVVQKTGQERTTWTWSTTCYSDKKIDKSPRKNTNAPKISIFKTQCSFSDESSNFEDSIRTPNDSFGIR